MSWPFNSPDSFNGGFWTGRPGSLDWCEENYVHSPYIAETTNTLSNLSYIVLALYGLRNCQKHCLPTRFFLCNLCLFCVGLGSVAFHATLRSWTQAFDEMPMLYTVGFITYSTFDTIPHRRPWILPTIALAIACAWTVAYMHIENAIFHELSFAALGIFTTIRVLSLLPLQPRQTRLLYYQGFSIFVSGFLIWNLDNWYCPTLRTWRTRMGWPTTWFAQGHAYWHIATGVGAYRMIVASELLFLAITQGGEIYTVEGSLFPVVCRLRAKK